MAPDPGHRRRGLPRTEAEAAARAAEAEQAPPTTTETPEPTTPAPESSPIEKPAPAAPVTGGRYRRGLGGTPVPWEDAEATGQPAAPLAKQPAAEDPKPAEPEVAADRPIKPGRRIGLGGTPVPRSPGQAESEKPAPRRRGLGTPTPTPAEAKAETEHQEPPVEPVPAPAPEPKSAPESGPELAKKETATYFGRSAKQWGLLAAAGVGGVVVLASVIVLAVQWFLGTSAGAGFAERYPGQYPQPDAPDGYPWWLNWSHFFNVFLMALIIKTGIQIRGEARPQAYWTPKWNKKRKISLTIWLHQALDLLWVLNGVFFVVLLFATGYWTRVVPTSWEVFPNAVSAGLQYASLDWPTNHDWAHYNSLQELAYFTTIFIAAPLAIATGVRMSGLWPADNQALNKIFPTGVARAVHFPVMIYFVVFILVHVFLVFATGALRNLNLIYTGQDATNWTGFWLFAASLVVIIGGILATRALIVAPVASLFGRVGR